MSLAAAIKIGECLVRRALWHGHRCSWIGPLTRDAHENRAVYGVLGCDIYSGTAGIAWFLGHLFSATGDIAFRRTAEASMRQSLLGARRLKPAERCTLYVGAIGVALAATELAERLGVPEFEAESRSLLCKVVSQGRRGAPADLVTGTAGAIAGLIVLARRWPHDDLVEFAGRLADQTIRDAKRSPRGWSWNSGRENPFDLTGLSHGTAGIAYALLELSIVTGKRKYREAAESAFAYERSWYDIEQEDWPDLRGLTRGRLRKKAPLPFSAYWCHGSPGIALTRMRAWEILGDVRYRDEARAAVLKTRDAIRTAIESQRGEVSLCHGLAGNADVLHEAGVVLNDPAIPDLVRSAANAAELRARLRHPASPSLFLGSAGIGYLNLRLHDRRTPSVLLIRREQFA